MYGIIFPGKEEASFSNFRLWESLGSVVTYVYSPYLCTHLKLYLLLGLLLLGVCGYSAVAVLVSKNRKTQEREMSCRGKFVLDGDQLKSGEVAD